jgi:hypothetical protein
MFYNVTWVESVRSISLAWGGLEGVESPYENESALKRATPVISRRDGWWIVSCLQ